jgi:uncharacterized protein YgfB (UPF0149 family)
MADLQISVKDEQTAKQWLAMVQDINTDYQKAMTDAAETMINMQDFADGTLVDEFVKYGTSLMNAAQVTFQAIDAIADTVNTILSKVSNFAKDAVSGIGKLVSKILN